MKNLLIENLLIVCGGTLYGSAPGGEITAVTTDSRSVTPGCLFAAIRGQRVDGHDFIAGALAQGAACCLAERVPQGVEGCVILVQDTVQALQRLAGFYRAQFRFPVVGVTGSVGKTTAKEMLAAVLAERYTVHKTAGNFNNDLGVPLTLFGLREDHSAAVVELGVSHPGDMARIAAIARPTIALYTNIGDAHLEYLGSREGVAREKTEMNRFLPRDGLVLCNGDDPLLAGMPCAQKKITFGLGTGCDLRAGSVRTAAGGGLSCEITAGAQRFSVEIPAFGDHLVYAALGAAAAGLALGLSAEEIRAGIAHYRPLGSRGRLISTGMLRIIDDCYNANPTSMAAALRSLSRQSGRRVCILGDMLELGERAEALHTEIGQLAGSLGIELVLTAGPLGAHIAAGARGVSRHFPEKAALLEALPELLRQGDTVLVKASRGMHFEDVTAALERLEP